jgi:flagellar biosynthesis protein FlhG
VREHTTVAWTHLSGRGQREPGSNVPAPCIVALVGAQQGAGVTTIAINLAVALTELGVRVVAVDADLQRAELGTYCGTRPQAGVADILAARRDVHEVLVAGPAGILLLPSVPTPEAPNWSDLRGPRRFWRQLRTLGRHAEVVLLDLGPSPGPRIPEIWQTVDLGILVTTPDNRSALATYEAIKEEAGAAPRLHLVVNQADDPSRADDVHRRLAGTCQRFLNRELELLGVIPLDAHLRDHAPRAYPLVLEHPDSPAAAAMGHLAESLQPRLAHRRGGWT